MLSLAWPGPAALVALLLAALSAAALALPAGSRAVALSSVPPLRLLLGDSIGVPLFRGPSFQVMVLGAHGGSYEGDLSAYLVAPIGSSDYVCLDAGTLLTGLRLSVPAEPAVFLREHVKAYLISHAHLDHLLGLVLNSPEDSAKPILGLAPTLDAMRDHVFVRPTWLNFANEGERPLGRYTYLRLKPSEQALIPGTRMSVEAYPLSHPVPSTAFLLGQGGEYLLYCGDTGPDEVEQSECLGHLWNRVAPLVREGRLRAIFLEASFPDPRPDDQLFGHLTPHWLLAELRDLRERAGSLEGLTVVVTHLKSDAAGKVPEQAVARQLAEGNDLGVRFLFPHQGDKLEL